MKIKEIKNDGYCLDFIFEDGTKTMYINENRILGDNDKECKEYIRSVKRLYKLTRLKEDILLCDIDDIEEIEGNKEELEILGLNGLEDIEREIIRLNNFLKAIPVVKTNGYRLCSDFIVFFEDIYNVVDKTDNIQNVILTNTTIEEFNKCIERDMLDSIESLHIEDSWKSILQYMDNFCLCYDIDGDIFYSKEDIEEIIKEGEF